MSSVSGNRHRLVWVIGLGMLGAYLGANIIAVSFVPLLHRLEIDLLVVDARSTNAVADATINWLYSGPDGRTKAEPAGTTNSSGRALVVRTIQEQPIWAFPQIGSFRFENLLLGVVAEGYDESRSKLNDALPTLRYSNPRAELTVQLGPVDSGTEESRAPE